MAARITTTIAATVGCRLTFDMKCSYRGYEINVDREECLAGYSLLYFSVYREADGLEIICDYEDSAEKVHDMTKFMKNRVDQFIETRGESECMEEEY